MNSERLDYKGKIENLTSCLPKGHNAAVLAGSNDGWNKIIAWDPSDKLIVKNTLKKDALLNFISKNNAKKRLIVGAFSYDLGFELLKITSEKQSSEPLAILYAYDNYARIVNGQLEVFYRNPLFLKSLKKKVLSTQISVAVSDFVPSIERSRYQKMFNNAKQYIKSGDVYQINLTYPMQAKTKSEPREIFKLTAQNSNKMSAYLEVEGFEIISASPERFVSIDAKTNQISTYPIKGTANRGSSAALDEKYKNELIENQKEKAELSMISDLLRNDVAKISENNTVRLDKQREIHRMTNIFHTYSLITGRLKNNLTPIEGFLSMFPGGSITGCPKKRAMQIIDEIEPYKRGFYCGALVCITPDGSIDSSILIRTLIKKSNDMSLSVGGGIVFDSDPDKEFEETIAKSMGVRSVFRN